MAVVITRGQTFGVAEQITNTKLHNLVDLATISGIVNADISDSKEKSVSLLSTTTVALNANADTVLYTVPVGKRCVLHHATLVVGANAATTVISIGANGAETDFLPNNTLSALDAQYDAANLMPVPNATSVLVKSYAAGTVIEAKVSSQAGGVSNTLYLFGVLY